MIRRAMAHRVSSNIILIDNDSSCHGTTILFRINVQCMVDEAYLVRLLGDTYFRVRGWGCLTKNRFTRTKKIHYGLCHGTETGF
jgi:hypothetical protein